MHAHGVYSSQWTTRFTFFCIMRMLWEYQSFTVIYQLYKRDLHRNLIGGDFKSISFSPTHSLITSFTPSKRNIYFPRFGQNTTYQISYMPTHIKLYLCFNVLWVVYVIFEDRWPSIYVWPDKLIRNGGLDPTAIPPSTDISCGGRYYKVVESGMGMCSLLGWRVGGMQKNDIIYVRETSEWRCPLHTLNE